MDHALMLELRGSWLPMRPSATPSDDVVRMQASSPHPDLTSCDRHLADSVMAEADHGLNRILVRFETARMHLPRPALSDAETSPMTQRPAEELCGWLQRHGLQENEPVPLKGKPTSFIDIRYLDDELRVHTGESGTMYGE